MGLTKKHLNKALLVTTRSLIARIIKLEKRARQLEVADRICLEWQMKQDERES